jgi:hypothetical protein
MKKILFTLLLLGIVTSVQAQNSAALQMQLASDRIFQQRIAYLMVQYAVQTVAAEGTTPAACTGITTPSGLPCHTVRDAFAQRVIQSPIETAAASVVAIVGGVNLTGVTTTCTTVGAITTCTSAATDAAIASQIATFWNALSGAQ